MFLFLSRVGVFVFVVGSVRVYVIGVSLPAAVVIDVAFVCFCDWVL